jgi:hypothetical protein
VVGVELAPGARGALRLGTSASADATPVPLDQFLDRVRRQLAVRSGALP